MYQVTLSDKQLNNLLVCLDRELRFNGLSSLVMIVDLYNTLQSGEKINVEPEENFTFSQEKFQHGEEPELNME